MNTAIYGSLPASACTLGTQGSFGPDRIVKMTYDADSRPTVSTTAFGTTDAAAEATVTYSDNGQVATLKDGENNLTTYERDGFDRLSKLRYPLPPKGSNASSTTDYEQATYDANGNVTAFRSRAAQTINLSYDKLNRLTLKNLPGTEPDVTYAYDNLGRLKTASQTGNVLSFTFDALSCNLTQVGPQGSVTSAWDLAGRRTKLTYPDGYYLNYDYLVTGDTTKVRENGATSGIGVLATYAYDDLGSRVSTTFGNGVVQSFGYDPVARLTSLGLKFTGTANDLTLTYAYNPASQIVSTTRSNDLYAWTGHGNGTTATVANGLNQVTSVGGVSASHDANGNLTTDPTTGTAYTYTSENLLRTGTGATPPTLTYDPAMRLWELAAGTGATRFAYDGLEALTQQGSTGTLFRRYVFGPGTDEALIQYEGTGATTRKFLAADERGSIIAMSDDAGNVTAINSFDEYGKPGAGNQGAFQYTGQTWFPQLGLYYYKARMYDAQLGRFMQPDPIGTDGGINLYAYVGGDPVNLVDQFGLAIAYTYPNGVYNCDWLVGGWTCAWSPAFDVVGQQPGCGAVLCGYVGGLPPAPGRQGDPTKAPAGGGGAGGSPQSQTEKTRPSYCQSQIYQFANDVDRLGAWAQGAVLASGLAGKAEPYAVTRAAFGKGAAAGYEYIGAARLGANVVKAFYGDYGGGLKDIALNTLGKAVGGDVFIKSVAEFGIDVGSGPFLRSPCDDR